jgi:hypothetical protein
MTSGVSLRPRFARTLSRSRWPEYRELLVAALDAGYRAVSLEDWLRGGGESGSPELILRHDVDQHPRSALRMAEIESALGVSSSWYFRWRTAHPRVIAVLRAAGFDIGFHYETLTRRALEQGRPPHERDLEEGRALLRREIESFRRRCGPIRSITPHGDSRVPGVANADLMRDQDPRRYGVEFDANEAMRGRELAIWLTDRSSAEGSWVDRIDPVALLAEGGSPVLCLTHPNNWVSGPGLWLDRVLSAALPGDGAPSGLMHTGGDRPPV